MAVLLSRLLLAVGVAAASDVDVHEPPTENEPVEVDWIRVDSGEWLNGECLELTKNILTFDSDQAGIQEIDFDEVTDLVLSQSAIFVFVDKQRLEGIGVIAQDRVVVSTTVGPVDRDVDDLLQIIIGEDKEISRWELKASLGVNVARGNARQASLNGDVRVIRRGYVTRLELRYTGAFAIALVGDSEETTVNNHRGRGIYELYFTPRLYWGIVGGTVSYDEIQGIGLRAQPGTTLGWQPLDASRLTLDLSFGAGFQHTNFIAPDEPTINTGGVVSEVKADWDAPGALDVLASTSVFGDLAYENPSNQTTLYSRLDFEFEITSIIDLFFSFIHEFVAEPRGVNPNTGEAAQSNDFQYILSLGVTLD